MPEISEKAQKVLDDLLKTAPDKWERRICAGACVNRKTGELSGYGQGASLVGDICHYWTSGAGDTEIVFNTTKNIESEVQRAFAEWVVQDSPFAHGVLNRDNLDQIYHGGMVIDCSIVGEGGAFWLCKAMRYIYENSYRVDMFGRLIAKGVPPKAAFFVCSSYGTYGGQDKVAISQDHVLVQTNITKELFIKAYRVDKVVEPVRGRETATALGAGPLTGCQENWLGFGGTRVERTPDGWGGFTEKKVPANEKESIINLLAFLKENGLN